MQVQFNKLNGLKICYLLGTGPRFKILNKENYLMYVGILYIYEFEKSINSF